MPVIYPNVFGRQICAGFAEERPCSPGTHDDLVHVNAHENRHPSVGPSDDALDKVETMPITGCLDESETLFSMRASQAHGNACLAILIRSHAIQPAVSWAATAICAFSFDMWMVLQTG